MSITDYKTRYRRRVRLVTYFKILLGGSCVDCGLTDLSVLDFDHVDPTDKSFQIGGSHTRSISVVLEEILKCVLRCHSCHAVKTKQDRREGRIRTRRRKDTSTLSGGLLVCRSCGFEGDAINFSGKRTICLPCGRIENRRRHQAVREQIDSYKIGCKTCPETRKDALQFDHVRGQKGFDLASASVWNDKVKSEIEKCDVLCANCHLKKSQEARRSVNNG